MVEWYDWYVYAAFSLYFAKAFFPKGDTTAQLLNTAAIFAVGFLMRPIGGWLMGLYADKVGRKKALMASVYLTCFGSLPIALSPGYESIGIGAPILLVFARLLQGLSVGGEYGTSATYLSEMATKERRGFSSSFQYVTLISGQLIALAVLIVLQQVLTTEQLYAWGSAYPVRHRRPVRSRRAVPASWHGRNRVLHQERKSQGKRNAHLDASPQGTDDRGRPDHGRRPGVLHLHHLHAEIPGEHRRDEHLSDSTTISAATLFLFMCLQPIIGGLSGQGRPSSDPDHLRHPRHPVHRAYPHHPARHPVLVGRVLLIMAALIIVSGYASINAVVKAELFPTEIRALGMGLPRMPLARVDLRRYGSIRRAVVQSMGWKPATTGT